MNELLATTQSALGAVDDRRAQEYAKVATFLIIVIHLSHLGWPVFSYKGN